ncbi:MAG: hypothetical protein IPI85_00660 [Dehalococcoidia bacterium]|nr:hypothetical protein [Dehalococcoidia bacterium]
MAEGDPQSIEAWNTSVRLAAAVGRLKIGSNLKASADAQAKAFELAGIACGLIAEAAGREGPAQAGILRDARGALAQCKSWIHVLAAVTNEQESVFGNEIDLVDQASRQITAYVRSIERGPVQAGPRPPMRPGGGQPPRPGGPPRNPGGPR